MTLKFLAWKTEIKNIASKTGFLEDNLVLSIKTSNGAYFSHTRSTLGIYPTEKLTISLTHAHAKTFTAAQLALTKKKKTNEMSIERIQCNELQPHK